MLLVLVYKLQGIRKVRVEILRFTDNDNARNCHFVSVLINYYKEALQVLEI